MAKYSTEFFAKKGREGQKKLRKTLGEAEYRRRKGAAFKGKAVIPEDAVKPLED